MLDFLEFHHTPADGALHIHRLYAQDGDDKPIGLCYVVPLGEDLNDTIKGRQPMARAAMALRARDLRWGILTNGDQWRLLDAQALRRLNRLYADLSIGEMEYSQDRGVILAELTVLTLPDETEIVEAGCYLDTLAGIWPKATEEEQSRIVKMVLERVYYDLGELQLVSVVPKPAFLPLFRLTPGIQGVRQREFAPHAGVGGEVALYEQRCSPHTHREPSSQERETTEHGSFTRS